MAKFYHCTVCENLFESIDDSGVIPVCCGEPMELLKPASKDGAHEKHVPVYSINGSTITVTVGEMPHPMEKEHYIEWIAIYTECCCYRKMLKPNDSPTATFNLCKGEKVQKIYAYCNLHGLWEAK